MSTILITGASNGIGRAFALACAATGRYTKIILNSGHDAAALEEKVRSWQTHCVGASRAGANGAGAKLEYALRSACTGVEVLIANARYPIVKILSGEANRTRIAIEND